MKRKITTLDEKKARRENIAVPEIEAKRKPESGESPKKPATNYSTQSLSVVDPEVLKELCFAFATQDEVTENRTNRARKLAEETLRQILGDIQEILLVYPDAPTMSYSFTSAIPEDVREMVYATLYKLGWTFNLDGSQMENLIIVLPKIQSAIVVKKLPTSRKSAL